MSISQGTNLTVAMDLDCVAAQDSIYLLKGTSPAAQARQSLGECRAATWPEQQRGLARLQSSSPWQPKRMFQRRPSDLARSSFGALAPGVRQLPRAEAKVVGASGSIAWWGLVLQDSGMAPALLAQCFQLLGDAG